MRKIPVCVLALLCSLLVWCSALQAAPSPASPAPPDAGPPRLSEFRLYFLHLANLDAAADKADAEGTAADTDGWRRYEQDMVGLDDREGAILKDVAYRCNQALQDQAAAIEAARAEPQETVAAPAPMETVKAAVDELRTLLGPAAFESVARRIRVFLRPGITSVPAAAATESLPPDDGSGSGEDEIPVDVDATGPSINISALTYKLPDGSFMAECATTPNDSETIRRYMGGVVSSCLLYGSGPTGTPVPCAPSSLGTTCSGHYPAAPPATSRLTMATHGVRMLYSGTCLGQFFPGLEDPFHYCRNGSLPPHYIETGNVPPLGGTGMCWDGYPQIDSCTIATSVSSTIVYLDIVPHQGTVYAGGQLQFRGILDMLATWSVIEGPGEIDDTGLYKAPSTITSQQTAKIKACDAYTPGDCVTGTVTLMPYTVNVTPASSDVLPGAGIEFTANVVPSSPEQTVTWSLSTRPGDPTGIFTPNAADSAKGTYTAPADNPVLVIEDVTVKACAKRHPASDPVCATARVGVKKIQFYLAASKSAVLPGESVQVTAFVQGSATPLKLLWTLPAAGTLTPAIPGETLDDTYVVVYKAPALPEGSGVDVKACLKDSPTFCATHHFSFLSALDVTSITPDSGAWNAGTMTSFTILGHGFGSNPTVTFGSAQTSVTLATDTKIQGQVRLLVALGGKSIRPNVKVTYPNGDYNEASPISISIALASLSVSPSTATLHAGESQQFSAVCQTSTSPCTSLETPTWSASPGQIDLTGKYTAPPSVTANTTATVTACWGIGYCATAQVSLLPPSGPAVAVSPKTVSLKPGQTQQFTAQVTNSTNTAVNWSIPPGAPGNLSAGGLYTAPATFGGAATVTVTATSQADATRKDTATVTLVPAPLTLTSTPSPAVSYGTPITWTATASGGVPGTYQYAIFRRKAGTTIWIPALDSPAWQSSNVLSWTPATADAGTWDIRIGVRDSNTPVNAPVLHDPGQVQVVAPLTITCTPSPAYAFVGTTVSWTATASGGTGVGRQFAFFRRKAGTSSWIPAVSTPAWQASNTVSWITASTDAGTWDISIWARDSSTPANANGYGYASYCIPGPVQIVTPLTLTSTPSPAAVYAGQPITWTLTATGGVPGTYQYAWGRKRVGAATWMPDTPVWQTGNSITWTPAPADVGAWEFAMVAKDASTPPTMNGLGYAAYTNPGQVNVVAPLTVTVTPSPAAAPYGTALTWTATASGGTGAGRQYAFFRRPAGTSAWTPAVTSPAWQTGNVMSWTPGAGDVGTWDTYVWVKDSATPPTMSTYGYAAGYNTGPVQIVAPLGLTSTPSPALADYGKTIVWTATPSGGTGVGRQYALFRKRSGTTTWIPAQSTPAWQTGNLLSWTPASADAGTWDILIWVRDSSVPANGYGGSYNPGSVQVVAPLSITGTSSPAAVYHGNPVTWTVTGSGGTGVGRQYALFRKKVGASTWIPAAPAWQTGSVLTWTPASTEVGTWDIVVWFRDANTPASVAYATYYVPGQVQVYAHPAVTGTGSPASAIWGTTLTWTATGSGGIGSAKQYALFRRKGGTSNWIPAVTSPAWQSSNVLSWTPGSTDVGGWEIIIWMKDANTPPTMNGYGYAAYYNAGPVEVTDPIYQYYAPTGWVDGVDNQNIWGWACDPDYPWESNRVDIWTTDWRYLGTAEASFSSSAPINSACGGGYAHYFSFHHGGSIPSGTQFLVWSIDLPYATQGNDNRPIGGNNSTGNGTVFIMP